jgi:serine protease Do
LVKLRAGKEVDASVLRVDEAQDVALLKIKGADHQCLRVAASGQPAVGTDVYVLGAPLGEELASSVTRGVVSGSRKIEKLDYLQTDAAINPGNSGGPLLDTSGAVVGVVSGKIVGRAVEGIGFGVPAPVATRSLAISWR